MYLKSLELVGFKSFPEKTRLDFERGITAIVGPNGCGKSNIADSIRWVLGEQSMKGLRASQMQDVIFNGTEDRSSLGMAEVGLILENKDRKLSLDSDQIEIKRRIFRSGESEYLINKAPVRLKDILDLLMGTGIGAESYSLIEQGKIDLLLSSRPEERRLIFDEASGISKYKAQKKESQRKLEETEANLLRLNDIITEVKRQINSLERQASRARHYKETFEQLKNKEHGLSCYQVNITRKELQDLESRLNSSNTEIRTSQLQIEELRKDALLYEQRLREEEQKISQDKEVLLRLEVFLDNSKQQLRLNRERITELEAQKEELVHLVEEADQRLLEAEENSNNYKEEYLKFQHSLNEKKKLLSRTQEEYEEINVSLHKAEEDLKAAKKDFFDLVTKLTNTTNAFIDLNTQKKSSEVRKRRLDLEKIKTEQERKRLEEALNLEVNQLNRLQSELNVHKEKLEHLSSDLNKQREAQDLLLAQIQELENKVIVLKSQKEFLEELRLKYEDITDLMQAQLYLEPAKEEDLSGIIIKVREKKLVSEGEKKRLLILGDAKSMPLETETISARIDEVIAQLQKKKDSLGELRASQEELNSGISSEEKEIQNYEILISGRFVQKENLTQDLTKISEEEAVIDSELSETEEELQQIAQRQIQLETEEEEGRKQKESLEQMIKNLEGSISDFNSKHQQTLLRITGVEAQIETHTSHVSESEQTVKVLEDGLNEARNLKEHYLKEREAVRGRLDDLSHRVVELENKIKEAIRQRDDVSNTLGAKENQYSESEKILENLRKQLDREGTSLQGRQKEIYELELKIQDLDFKIQTIQNRVRQLYNLDLSKTEEIPQIEPEEELKREIEQLKNKVDSYGTVNLIAIEEYEEFKKRYDFLTQQQSDLIQAKQSLVDVISKINKKASQMFNEIFNKVAQEFKNYFRLLFNGGDAQLILVDERDLLESGIEIICRPPGKRLQNVLLLSGGEKALSCAALIFAIFKVKPAPFCVLDEVDAPLDEVNIERFSRILQEFAKDSQFLIITHSKRTIANADVMYGITMQKQGVSKIVSVKFSESNKEAVPKENTLPL
ncbi:MAG: AAA family ATPase [Candidatus Omnitrophica bacterium]|nr:AAA family ATPase [Candidatus Omnitrophota bacterium]